MPKTAVAASTPQYLPPTKPLSPFELEAANEERERLVTRLNNARQALQRRRDELDEVGRREEQAIKFSNISSGISGFDSHRLRAQELIEHCANRRRELEPLVENRLREVSELEQKLSRVPEAALDRSSELIELGRSLSSPLP
jgi:chromosome segregation ATPase